MLQKLTTRMRFLYKTMTPEDYLFNQRDSQLTTSSHIKVLQPLDNANQGDMLVSDEIQLVGVPKGNTKHKFQSFDTFQQLLIGSEKDLIFLQIDPSAYIARQRFMAHRCAMGEVQDYRLDGVTAIDPHRPISWQQTVVNLLTMDMMDKNGLPKQLSYKDGFYSYSYPYIQQKQQSKAITQNFITQISTQILDNQRTGYNMIDQVLYSGLMGRHKIMLGGMPETQYRMILGKGISVEEMRDIFRLVILKNKQLKVPFGIKQASQNFLPHIFQLPKDLYMTAILKQSFQAAMQMISFVGIEHWRPIQQYWQGPPYGINMTQATRIPQGFAGETAQDLIEKQALLDVMLQSRVWSKQYLANPFPYLFEDITKVDKKQLEHYKSLFIKYYRKYSEFKNKQIKLLESNVQNLSLEHKQSLSQEQVNRMKDSLRDTPSLKHLKNKMVMNVDKSIKINS